MNAFIYAIVNIRNSKMYIGSTNFLRGRLLRHFSELRQNKHTNKYLQNAYTKEPDNFIAFTIDECLIEDQWKTEQYWINFYPKEILYNIALDVLAPGKCTKGKICTKQTRELLSKAKMGHAPTLGFTGHKHSQESIKKISEASKKQVKSESTKKKLRKPIIGWKLDNPEEIFQFESVVAAAQFLNCHHGNICHVLKGKYEHTHRWVFKYQSN